MDRSIGRLPDPRTGLPTPERRSCVRQKLHTPVYASFNGSQTGVTVDLSELLDLHEDGFSVQTGQRLETQQAVNICLDLPETKTFVHGSGQVIWSDESGRGGIRFSQLGQGSHKALKEWLFSNLLIASVNHQARSAQLARHATEKAREPVPPAELNNLRERFGRSPLESVRREIREIGHDVEAVQQVITDHALRLTGATGAGLAWLTDDRMIWRARSGEPSPPVGATVDLNQGISGECIHAGLVVSCEDLENDARVDPEVGRSLGIGSLMACPIVSDFRVVGLLEIFSPHAHRFTREHGAVLERLAELVPKVHLSSQVETAAPRGLAAGPENSQAVASVLQPSPCNVAEAQAVTTLADSAEVEPLCAAAPPLEEQPSEDRSGAQKEFAQSQNGFAGSALSAPELEPESLPESEIASETHSRLLYRALLGLTIAAVALAVGYVVGPMIERRWPSSWQSQRSSLTGVDAASSSSWRDPSGRTSVDQHGPIRSVADLQEFAERGDPEAQWQMAVHYHNGDGVPQDDTQAMKWFERAAEQGHVDAQSRLGAYYWAGRGVPEDLSKAYYWSAIATAQGDEISRSRLEGLTYQMTRAQITAARQEAEVWLHSHNRQAKPEVNVPSETGKHSQP